MKAIIVDDHPLARVAIKNLLDANGITLLAELDDGGHVVNKVETLKPDLVIIDVDIPTISGIEVLEQLRKRRYAGTVIIISAKNEVFYGHRSAEFGANGFVSKKEGLNNIIAAIEAAKNGYGYFPFTLNRFFGETSSEQDKLESLSMQEIKVFRYIINGIDYTNIASKMNISNKTVCTYKRRLLEKLNCNSLMDLFSFAQRNKLG